MNDRTNGGAPDGEGWDTYWHGAQSGSAYSGGGSTHPLILDFWVGYFSNAVRRDQSPRVVDIASGNGAVVECAQTAFGGELPPFTCVDLSSSAIAMLQKRFPHVQCIVADARQIPLPDAAFDIATSQFGIEYAGLAAIDEVARLVADGGQLAMLIHHRDGGIYRQCAASRDAIASMRDARFIALGIEMFRQGFAAMQSGDRSGYQAAAKDFAPSIPAVESILKQYGTEVADETIVRLYRDVRTMHERMRHYEPDEVISWLQRMQEEIDAYALRMTSMCEAAVSAPEFEDLCSNLRRQGFETVRAEPLVLADKNLPLAWALVAQKS